MDPEFKQWLEQQTYTLTSMGWKYRWNELVFHAKRTDYKKEYTWALWRKIG